MNGDGRTHRQDGEICFNVLVQQIRQHARRKAGSGLCLRFRAHPNGDKKRKPKQYEIAIKASAEAAYNAAVKEWHPVTGVEIAEVGIQVYEVLAYNRTAVLLYRMKQMGAIYSGWLGDILNFGAWHGIEIELKPEVLPDWERLAAKEGFSLQEQIDRSLKHYSVNMNSGELELPKCAVQILP